MPHRTAKVSRSKTRENCWGVSQSWVSGSLTRDAYRSPRSGGAAPFSSVVVSVAQLRTSRRGRCNAVFRRAAWITSPTKKGSTKMKAINEMKKGIVMVLILMGFCVPNAFAGTWTVSLYETGLEIIQPVLQTIHYHEPFKPSTRHTNRVQARARNPRPYTGPTEVVAPGATCPNGLAVNPFTHQC